MILERGCAERGCACYDVRVDEGVEVKTVRELTDEKIWKLWQTHLNDDITVFAIAILAKACN